MFFREADQMGVLYIFGYLILKIFILPSFFCYLDNFNKRKYSLFIFIYQNLELDDESKQNGKAWRLLHIENFLNIYEKR